MCSLSFKIEHCNASTNLCYAVNSREHNYIDISKLKAQSKDNIHLVQNSGGPAINGDDANYLRICRICLATNCKMYFLKNAELRQMIEILLDEDMISARGLPMAVCWECCGRLGAASSLRDKARRAHTILLGLLDQAYSINMKSLEYIDRHERGLESSLVTVMAEVLDIDPSKNEHGFTDVTFRNLEDNIGVLQNLVELVPDEFVKLVNFPEDYDDEVDSNDQNDCIEEFLEVDSPKEKMKEKQVKRGANKKNKKIKENNKKETKLMSSKKFPFKTKEELDKLLSAGFIIRELTSREQIEEFEMRKSHDKYVLRDFKCTVCYTGFSEKSKYRNHLLKHKEIWGKYKCSICKLRVKTNANLNKHMKEVHTVEYSCRKCKMVTKNRSAAVCHLNGHTDSKIQCPLCPAEFSYRSTYMNHRRIKHASEYVCELCGYAFINKMGIKMHKRKTHPLDKSVLTGPYCEACNVKFVSNEAYNKHLALSSKHSTEDTRKEVRNDCTAKAPKSGPRTAQRKPLAKMPIVCELCGAVVMGVVAYAHHFRVQHPGERRAQYPQRTTPTLMCDQCGRKFRSHGGLEDHMSAHSGERRFECDACHKRFLTKSYLAVHVKRHAADAQRFPCQQCGKRFQLQRSLDRHVVTHTELRGFECGYCAKSFKWSESLRLHVTHVHMKVPWPKRSRGRRP